MATWVVERTQDRRFPFRITIEQEGRTLLAVRAQSQWPGAGSQIFWLRETEFDPAESLEPVERVPVAHLARLGRKLSVTLDRAQRKRCEFPGARVTRRKLPVEDYALVEDERLVAVVERKTRENFLGNVHEIKGLHQQLAELGSYPHAAMVVEAQYADFGNPAKIGRWPASHLLRVIGEIAALHPTVPLVFAGNRKLANLWTQRFFAGVAAAQHQALPAFVREPVARYDAEPADGGMDTRVRIAALRELPDAFEFALLRGRFAEVPELRLRRILNQLRAEGRLRCQGRGQAARWVRVENQEPLPAKKSE